MNKHSLSSVFKKSEKRKIQPGDVFPSKSGKNYEVIRISPTALTLVAKNLTTNQLVKFRWYEPTGKYENNNGTISLDTDIHYETESR